jgi:ABC-2 type transport system ATP-binding protein
LTVGEYLDFYGASHRIPAPRRRQLCDELLELVDLTDKRSESVEALSRGMKQRLGLARCLVHDPDVLLLDEPASGMDPRARIELREILRELSNLNKTILISSHILPELAEMCTHIGIIRAGEMIAEGPVDAVISALTTGARLRVRVLSAEHVAEVTKILEEDPQCENVEADGDRSVVTLFRGGDDELAALLVRTQGSGVQLTGFGVEGNTLEDIFLQITELNEAGE